MSYKSVELFAGAGGLALGLEQAGFESKGLVEIDKHACATLRRNRPSWNIIEGDIIKIAEEGIKKHIPNTEIDLVSGGYPCQAFSYAGKQLGFEDVRGTMFFYFAKIVKELKPKVFLAENVRGLLSHDKGRTLQTMLNVYTEIGYHTEVHLVNAADYGVAQKRERVILIGIRNDLQEKYELPQKHDKIVTLKEALKNVPKSEGVKYSEKKKAVLDLVPEGGNWRNLPTDIAKKYMGKSYYLGGGKTGIARRMSWDKPCLTLTCAPAQMQTERCHPDETRPFTVREYARIQGFPDEWIFEGGIGAKYKQIGNAVPVGLAKAIGQSMHNLLDKISKK